MKFGYTIDFKDNKPPFYVRSVEEGYKFIFLENGEEDSSFTVNSDVVEHTYQATGYTGIEADAIEKFRQFGREAWPERFK